MKIILEDIKTNNEASSKSSKVAKEYKTGLHFEETKTVKHENTGSESASSILDEFYKFNQEKKLLREEIVKVIKIKNRIKEFLKTIIVLQFIIIGEP